MSPERLFAHKLRNDLQTFALIALLALLCAYLAWFVGGPVVAWGAIAAVATLYFANPAASPRLVMSLYQGRAISPAAAPRLYRILSELSRRAGLERPPALYYLPTRLMNAFTAGGREDAVIAVSDGLLRRMDLRELTGVLAHEVSHLANGDTRAMAFADLVSRITSVLSLVGQLLLLASLPLWLFSAADIPWLPILVLMLAPTLSALVQLALSRSREYEADRSAAALSGDPEGLVSALRKMDYYQAGLWERVVLPGRRLPDPSLLRTHPPTVDRVRRLLELREREGLPRAVAPLLSGPRPDPYDVLAGRVPSRPRWHIGGLWY
jgi:heat shock protein HtpX